MECYTMFVSEDILVQVTTTASPGSQEGTLPDQMCHLHHWCLTQTEAENGSILLYEDKQLENKTSPGW